MNISITAVEKRAGITEVIADEHSASLVLVSQGDWSSKGHLIDHNSQT